MLKLTSVLKAIGQLYKALTRTDTLAKGYIEFPNNFKVCWGNFGDMAWNSQITLPITFTAGSVFIQGVWSSNSAQASTNFSTNIMSGNKIMLHGINTSTRGPEQSFPYAGHYIVIGY